MSQNKRGCTNNLEYAIINHKPYLFMLKSYFCRSCKYLIIHLFILWVLVKYFPYKSYLGKHSVRQKAIYFKHKNYIRINVTYNK